MCVAMSAVNGTPSARMTSNTISPQAAAETSNQLSAPYMVLPRWWSMLMTNPRSRPSTPGALEIAALHHDHRVSGVIDAVGDLDVGDAGEHQHRRRRLVAADRAHALAERSEGKRHGQLRADGVAVWPDMRGDHEALPCPDGVGNLRSQSVSVAVVGIRRL